MNDPKEQKMTGSKSHPVGTGIGAAGGAVTGAAVGTAVGGPVGTVVGGAIGAAAGALAGQGVAEAINPAVEDAYWRDTYSTRDYVEKGQPYSDYGPAYRYGWESRERIDDRSFEEVEDDLGQKWNKVKGESRLGWDQAKHATRDAWHRVERALPGDADGDGR
jgi:phage tail tape-measure protein